MSLWTMAGATLLAAVLTGAVRAYALRVGMVDRANARSSHSGIVPRGGGASIVVIAMLAAAVLYSGGGLSLLDFAAWTLGGVAVATVGFVDDSRGLGVAPRAAVHLMASTLAAVASSGLPVLPMPDGAIDAGALGWIVAVLAVTWSINLHNFMDGIDGLAGAQSIFFFAAGAWLSTAGAMAGTGSQIPLMLAVAAASAGFLAWNWPPAKIFMGDVGSGFLGFAVAATALGAAAAGGPSPWAWLILGGTFVADATVTLFVRLARGERVYEAHRSHAYQRLARRWRSHVSVTLTYAAINVLWLLPCAWRAVRHPEQGLAVAAVALAPLLIAAFALGAGRPDDTSTGTARPG